MSIQPNPNIIGASRLVFTINSPLPGLATFEATPSAWRARSRASAAIRHPLRAARRPSPRAISHGMADGSQYDQIKPIGVALHIGRLRGLWPDDGDQPDDVDAAYSNPSVSVLLSGTLLAACRQLGYLDRRWIDLDDRQPGQIPASTRDVYLDDHYPRRVPLGTYSPNSNTSVEVRDSNNHTASQSFQAVGCRSFTRDANGRPLIFGTKIANRSIPSWLLTAALPRSWTLQARGASSLPARPTPPNTD